MMSKQQKLAFQAHKLAEKDVGEYLPAFKFCGWWLGYRQNQLWAKQEYQTTYGLKHGVEQIFKSLIDDLGLDPGLYRDGYVPESAVILYSSDDMDKHFMDSLEKYVSRNEV